MITCSPQNLLAQARCFTCLPPKKLRALESYVLCLGVDSGGIGGANLVPTGSQYSGGGTPTFTLTVELNTTYTILWGANDLSMTMGGATYTSTGAGTMITVYTKGNTQMVFTGTFAGTTVTAIVKVAPAAALPIASGFTFTLNAAGTQATASWDAPPSQVTATEVWTSSDGVTYALNSTVAVPTTSKVLTGPAAGSVLYCKIRWVNNTAQQGQFVTPLNVPDTDAANWAARVATNGSAASQQIVKYYSDFVISLKSASIWTKIFDMAVLVGIDSILARTPLKRTNGVDPWVATGVLTFTANGVHGDGNLTTHIDPGNIAASLSTASAGLTLYAATVPTSGSFHDCGTHNTAPTDGVYLWLRNGGNINSQLGAGGGSGVSVANPGKAGFYSANRISTTDHRVFFANSTTVFAQLGTSANAPLAMTVNQKFTLLTSWDWQAGTPTSPVPAGNVYSFLCSHNGLSAADDQSFYNAVQALLVNLGGGFA